MHLWKTLFLFHTRQAAAPGPITANVLPAFPSGHLTASAWEGWWHDETPAELDTCMTKETTIKRGTKCGW